MNAHDDFPATLALVLVALVAGALLLVTIRAFDRIDNLQTRVACLEHPHQESSIAVKKVGARIVTTSGPTLTGCRP